jgi:imidazolonepropionase-like amidohydrolase
MKSVLFAVLAMAPLSAQTILVQNATILTVAKGTVKGSILVRDGKIAEVGERLMVPQGATVIDATGQYVIPGIVDPHSHIACDGSVNEGSISDSSMCDIRDVLNPEDIAIYRALAGGVTSAHILHGSANSVGGQTITIKMRWGKDAQGLLFEGAPPGLKFALGENPKRSGNPSGRTASGAAPAARYPATRMGVEDVIRQSFNEAKAYRAEWSDYRARVARGEHPIPPRKDLRLEPLAEVLDGKRIVNCHGYRQDELLAMLRVGQDFGFKIADFVHGLEGYKIAREIAAAGAGVTTFSDWWAFKAEAMDAIPYNAAILAKKGVLVSLDSDDDELMRHMNMEAAKLMKYGGMSEGDALATVTLNPAKQLGIEKRVGSIEPGKDADLVIYDKYPLSGLAKVQKVLIDGAVYFDRDKALQESAANQKERQRLIEKEKQNRQQQRQQQRQEQAPQQEQAPPVRRASA